MPATAAGGTQQAREGRVWWCSSAALPATRRGNFSAFLQPAPLLHRQHPPGEMCRDRTVAPAPKSSWGMARADSQPSPSQEMLPSWKEPTVKRLHFPNVSTAFFPKFHPLKPLAWLPPPPPPSTLSYLPRKPGQTDLHPQQSRAFTLFSGSKCPFMANPASCFLPCS